MEWARGIVVSGGELWAEVESTNGATGLVALTASVDWLNQYCQLFWSAPVWT